MTKRARADRSWFPRAAAVALAGILLLLFFRVIQQQVDARIALTDGDWDLDHFQLPLWFPDGFRGELQHLSTIPQRVSLRSPYWRRHVKAEMLANPWVSAVDSLEFEGGALRYSAQFVRPVVGVRCSNAFLLLDSRRRVIDLDRGDSLNPQWGIPEFHVRGGPLACQAAGSTIELGELDQVLAIVEPLASAGIFDRWPGKIREIYSDSGRDDDYFWSLLLDSGTRVEWGRSPASDLPQALATGIKVKNLADFFRQVENAPAVVELWVGDEPYLSTESTY